MEDTTIKMQMLALEHLEKTYGKDWKKRIKQSIPAITNAFVAGYVAKGNENKTVEKFYVNHKRIDKWMRLLGDLDPQKIVGLLESVLNIPVEAKSFIPEYLGVLVDDDENVLSFIEFK